MLVYDATCSWPCQDGIGFPGRDKRNMVGDNDSYLETAVGNLKGIGVVSFEVLSLGSFGVSKMVKLERAPTGLRQSVTD